MRAARKAADGRLPPASPGKRTVPLESLRPFKSEDMVPGVRTAVYGRERAVGAKRRRWTTGSSFAYPLI